VYLSSGTGTRSAEMSKDVDIEKSKDVDIEKSKDVDIEKSRNVWKGVVRREAASNRMPA
jgi:hypothetical protein